jgi:hypothetical protein
MWHVYFLDKQIQYQLFTLQYCFALQTPHLIHWLARIQCTPLIPMAFRLPVYLTVDQVIFVFLSS